MSKALYLTILLIVLTHNQVIRVQPTITTIKTVDPVITLRTQSAFLYHGTVDIQITEGEQKVIDFFVEFVP